MPAFVGTQEVTPVVSTRTHHLMRVTDDHFIVVGDDVPAARWLTSELPAGDWFTEWDGSARGPLIVHVTRETCRG
jgi:hypothetical protein